MKATRIIYSKNLNQGKYDHLSDIALRLGKIRTEIWNEFGSLKGIDINHRNVRNQWVKEKKHFDVPGNLWKETLRDVIDDIKMSHESVKVKVRKSIKLHTSNKEEQKRLYMLLKSNKWQEDKYLSRQMRKYWNKGHNHCHNQLVVDSNNYITFERNSKIWLRVISLIHRQRISIPLNSTVKPTGTLRLILRDNKVEVHYSIDVEQREATGTKTIGVDKGYTEVYCDSDGERYGEGLGTTLSKESDYLKVKYQRRNKLKAIAEKSNPKKTERINKNNLGRKKLERRKKLHTSKVRNIIYKATHKVFDKANNVACEDLTKTIKSKKKNYSKNQKRRLSGWVKGMLAEALKIVSYRRSSSIHHVNCAYTSQVDSRHGVLLGQRKRDSFHCFDGVVLDDDMNGAENIRVRLFDHEIDQWTSYKKVRSILLERTERFRLGLAQPRLQLQTSGLSTECELPF